MTRSRALNRLRRYEAHRHGRLWSAGFRTLRSGGEVEQPDAGNRLKRHALERDLWLEVREQEPAL